MLQVAIPALPVADMGAAVDVYRTNFGFTLVHVDAGMAILRRDGIELHLWLADDQRWRTGIDQLRPVRSGAESFLAGTGSCRIQTTAVALLFDELQVAAVLHPTASDLVRTAWGTEEFHTLDHDGNLLTFFEPL